MAELRPHVSEIEKHADVVVIGSGAPHFARAFKEDLQIDVPVYSDEKLESYRLAGLRRGVATLLHPAALAKGVVSFFKYPQRRTMGDPTQQGGAMIVKPSGTIAYRFVSRYGGDHPKPETLVDEALKAAS